MLGFFTGKIGLWVVINAAEGQDEELIADLVIDKIQTELVGEGLIYG